MVAALCDGTVRVKLMAFSGGAVRAGTCLKAGRGRLMGQNCGDGSSVGAGFVELITSPLKAHSPSGNTTSR